MAATDQPAPDTLRRLDREYALRAELDPTWAVRPLELARREGRPVLVLEDPGGEPLERLLGAPLEQGLLLRLAVGLAAALRELHARGVIHKDVKPANVLVDTATGRVWLTGFGIASRLRRERQAPEPPEVIAGTLPYMAPEQTGRMNRSIDSRSDLYALGVTLYQALTGSLPFTATEALEWVHCHIARRPVPPSTRVKDVPSQVSAIIMKLLAKTPEERYQTAAGVERDLRRCLADWDTRRVVDEFPLGEHDRPDRLLIPEHLYGREREIDALLAAFHHVVASGTPSLVLVSGHPGIGKSSVVNELHKVLVPPRGLFASGKFDQLKRDIPYATLAQAFQSLIRRLLTKPEVELTTWRDDLRQALHPIGALVVEIIPELKIIIGEQPDVPELPPPDAKARFQLAFRRLIGVFARAEHPLALFLDDLQWLDAATLDLLEDVLVQRDLHDLLLVGAYRDTEVDASHPLMRKVAGIRKKGTAVQEIVLAPLNQEDLAHLIADTVHCEPHRASPLAELVHQKTAGNPFFANQFIQELVEEGSITFDSGQARWLWDLGPIHAKGYTDNVVDLMVGKLSRLPLTTREALKDLACLGNRAETSTLSILRGTSEEEVHSDLWEARRSELIVRAQDSYRFVHDRVQEAVYSLIPEEQRAQAHLRIGRLLTAHVESDRREEAIFEIVGQLNRGSALMASPDEREQLAELDLIAGKRAKAAAAHASALNYLIAGVALVPKDGWERRHDLIFELELHRAECEFLTGEMASAEEHLRMLRSRAADAGQRAAVACLAADVYWALQRPDRGLADCLECLRDAGLDIPIHPTEAQAQTAYGEICSKLDGVGIDELAERPLMTDPTSRAILNVLAKVLPSAVIVDKNLVSLIVCAAVDISLERGHCDSSCFAYEYLGFIAGWNFGDFAAGFRFGRLGHELVERKGMRKFEGFVGLILSSCVMPWARHIASCRDLLRTTFEVANKIGDRLSAVSSRGELVSNLLFAGEPLVEAEKEAEVGLEFCRRAAFSDDIHRGDIQAAFIRNLRGLTHPFGSLDDERFDELRMRDQFATQPHLRACEYWYWVRRLQARFFAGDYAAALEASIRAQGLLSESPGALELVEHELCSALTHAAVCDSASSDERRRHLDAVGAHLRQLEAWARDCPENFENRAALVAAEIARIEGRDPDAMRLYEQAIRSARKNGFVHNEALAHELAARFYADRGVESIAQTCLRNARYSYLRWGADGKVRQLERAHPYLREEATTSGQASTIGAPVEQLDLATVVKVSEAVSGEIVPEKLIEVLLRTAVEHAGAQRGLLILSRDGDLSGEAEANTVGDTLTVRLRKAPVAGAELPESVIRYAARTLESVVLDDASAPSPFSADEYIRGAHARSVFCLPLVKQGRLVALLYLENSLAPNVFTPTRTAALRMLASQAAMALENSRLYRELQERESKIRRLVDANVVGVLISKVDGQVVEANDAFLEMVGFTRDDLASGRIMWRELTPPEWQPATRQAVAQLRARGSADLFEKEYVRKDGTRVPVLIAAAALEGTPLQSVAFVVNLTERKQAEAERERLRQLQADLARISRITTMGEMTASLAHEIRQPITAASTNARACVRFLAREHPDVAEARVAAEEMAEDTYRAAEIINRVSSLYRKGTPQRQPVDANEVALETLALLRAEAERQGVSLRTELASDLPRVAADRVQLQQVFMNLMLNAIEAMQGTGGELGVRSERGRHDELLFSVSDTGPGLPADKADTIFDAFFTTKPQGTGMGLSMSRSIIESHGGRLWARSGAGPGATFQFSLPARGDF
jgi:PAS domain S-box-containing protein